MAALCLQLVFPFEEWSEIGVIQVVRDCSGFATLQWLIKRSWSCRHLVCMCCKTMQIIDLAGCLGHSLAGNMKPAGAPIATDRLVI